MKKHARTAPRHGCKRCETLIFLATAAFVTTVAVSACSSPQSGNESAKTGASKEDARATDASFSADDAALSLDANVAEDAGVRPSDAAGAVDASLDGGGFTLRSAAFGDTEKIPSTHACNGIDASPALSWSQAPAGTQSYAVVMRDVSLDAANYHWVIYDIPAATTSLGQGVEKALLPTVPAGAKQTSRSFGPTLGYSGPCPPAIHTYQFVVYSFATLTLPIPEGTTDPAAADGILQAQKTGQATLSGTYEQ